MARDSYSLPTEMLRDEMGLRRAEEDQPQPRSARFLDLLLEPQERRHDVGTRDLDDQRDRALRTPGPRVNAYNARGDYGVAPEQPA